MNSTILNPLLDFSGLPRFSEIEPEHIESDIDDLLYICNAALTLVTEPDFPATWNDLAHTLDVATERLSRAWGMVTHL
ncbi:MAG: oligopeptidase A, partial [Limnohabitans sp.]|nr:oligopeptidase A [Limnohabitans sp.]